MLSELKGELTTQLDALFDPESKSSALARMEAVFADAAALQARSVRAVLDPANDKGPLGLWRAEVLGAVREQVGLVLTQLTEVAATVAAADAHAETFKLTAVKGQSFEDQLHPIIGMLAQRHGDLADHVGHQKAQPAPSAGRGGDPRRGRYRRALLPPSSSRPSTASSACARSWTSSTRLWRTAPPQQLSQSSPSRPRSPTAVPFTYFANKAIVVLDPEPPSEQTLELRLHVGSLGGPQGARSRRHRPLDVDRIEAIIGDARRGLTRISTIRRCHSTAKRQIEAASGEVDALISDVDGALCALALELRS